MGNAWEKRYFCISSFSLLYKLVCLSCPGLAWKYPNINYITLYTPLFSQLLFTYSGVITIAYANEIHTCTRTRYNVRQKQFRMTIKILLRNEKD